MIESAKACPACDASEFDLFGLKNGFEMRSCRHCRSLAAVGDYGVGSLYEGIYAAPPGLTAGSRAGLLRIMERLDEGGGSGRLLDYGFGAGDLMRIARERGWSVAGIEYSERARSRAEADGFEVAEDASGFSGRVFDAVTMIEVVEHLPDAKNALCSAFERLRPGGLLYVTTPNARGLNPLLLGLRWSVVEPPDHRVLFSRSGLVRMAAHAGFEVVSIRSEGLNPTEWRRRRARASGSGSDPGPAPSQELNERFEGRRSLRAFKRSANALLSLSQLGDTLKMLARKP